MKPEFQKVRVPKILSPNSQDMGDPKIRPEKYFGIEANKPENLGFWVIKPDFFCYWAIKPEILNEIFQFNLFLYLVVSQTHSL